MEIPQSNDRRHDALGDLRILPDELFCALLEYLTPRDVARLSCVSSVMYILCNEEPLWMHLCLNNSRGLLEYKGSWKGTTLHHLNVSDEFAKSPTKPLHFDGFNSLFLYRRWYRCFTTLDSFFIDKGVLERKKDLSLEEFRREYDVRKPVLLTDLAETWPARSTWTTDQLLQNYGDTAFKISQRSSKKITMRFTDYVAYMKLQHDEDPLYIFDDKFGEVAPGLLKDYSVPHLFREDFFDVLERDQRPAFRWLIIGPERSGASWHVDPALTSAWNTLLSGRKRWALYPPGRVPLGVTVHVNEEDGDVNVEAPSSLQWWLDIYPLLADEDKPIECTQLPGETIYVPSGWWHCVLNLETTIAVTQNFVNTSNFEFVCLDMAPGYHHKGVCRAGLLAVDENYSVNVEKDLSCDTDQFNFPDMTRREKRRRFSKPRKEPCVDNGDGNATNGVNQEFSYHINFLSRFLEEDRDHYNSIWSESNCIGQREMRQWLHKLWVVKPGIRELIWKGACLALNAGNWSARMAEICASHDLPSPLDDERLPVGTGSNPVYLTGDKVIKIYVEGGLESSIHSLGTELEFYSLLDKVKSPLREHIPNVLASGILFHESGSHRIVPWDGKGVPDVIAKCDLVRGNCTTDGFHFGVWSKKQLEARKDGSLLPIATASAQPRIWPYIITKRCKGNIFANLRDELPWDDVLNLASFLGDQLHNLHILPLPSLHDLMYLEVKYEMISTRTIHNDSGKDSNRPSGNASREAICENFSIPVEWDLFIKILTKRRKNVSNHLAKWGSPIPSSLIEKIDEYIPHNVAVLLDTFKDKDGLYKVSKSPTWIHSDIMDDNVHMKPCVPTHCLDENGCNGDEKQRKWNPSHILDFSDLSIGDPIFDLIPIHLDIFRGDSQLLKKFLESYRLPLAGRPSEDDMLLDGKVESKFRRLSYRAMCYCILHEDNVLGAVFSLQKELKSAKSWEEVEETVWGELNKYQVFC
ncbi:lysine-specific demethylase JMJ21 isoform X2 [Magnolia sinica]|uniref:lysine-specific demethylase JMJ21 isoform X2 n=1 Tax=Magnolia sinica TaxID=86752 RepID=UPI002658C559|nr:lysine-specific demethylase JMJ21 isoform X2 [Magnolia sinica]